MSRQFLPLSLPTLYILPRLHILEHWGRGGVWRIPFIFTVYIHTIPHILHPYPSQGGDEGDHIYDVYMGGPHGVFSFLLLLPAGEGVLWGFQDPGFCFSFLDFFGF